MARSCLGAFAAHTMLGGQNGLTMVRAAGGLGREQTALSRAVPPAPGELALTAPLEAEEATKAAADSLLGDGKEPPGMFLALLLNDMSPTDDADLARVRQHRWTFRGAEDLAMRGRSFCCFIRCLLDLQRNVQVEEEGDGLDPSLAKACKCFVTSNCREGRMGDMYQLLTHFISNSVIFSEWDKFLKIIFEDQRSNQESFLVPHLQQVWTRFNRFRAVLENIFDLLNSRFIWRHRLPQVGNLVQEHMKRRCFNSEAVQRNELFAQATVRSDILKQVKFTFNIGELRPVNV